MKQLFAYLSLVVISFIILSCSEESLETDQYNQTRETLQHIVDSIHNNYVADNPEFPGGIAMKVISGSQSYFIAAGFPSQISAQHHFRAASCTKTFTATAILLLHQQGKLNIAHRITDLIPGTNEPYVPQNSSYDIPHKESIRILDLLRHRGGVFDIANENIPDTISAEVPYKGTNYVFYKAALEPDHTFDFDELVGIVALHKLTYGQPDTKYQYSNTGYSILGKIIERVSGQTFGEFLTTQILHPMSINNSHLPYSGSDSILTQPAVNGYVLYENNVYDVTNANVSQFVAEGNLITTLDDLSNFLHTLLSGGGVLSNNTINTLMMNCIPSGTIGAVSYGCGLSYTNNLGYGHNGATEGYLTLMKSDPSRNFTVVIFTNAWNLNNGLISISEQLTNILEEIAYYTKAALPGSFSQSTIK